MLFENAGGKGAVCRDQTRALQVLFDGDRAYGVRAQTTGGDAEEMHAPVVIDATGQQSMILHRLGLREEIPGLRKASIWAYYRGARRDPGVDEGATIILFTRDKNCWFWYIPLFDDTASVGLVSDTDHLLKGRGTPESVFEEELCNCPAVLGRLMNAELVSDFRVLRDFSYVSKRPAGPGWVLVGDAFGFLDPIYSSGVFFALKSGELAADCVVDALQNDDPSPERLGRWAEEFSQGVNWMRKLVHAFYTTEFSFGRFIREFPHHKKNLTDLLVGKIFHPGAGDIFNDMDPWLQEAREKAAGDKPAK